MILSLIDVDSNQIAHFSNKPGFKSRKYPIKIDVALDMVFNFIFLSNCLNNQGVELELYHKDDSEFYDFGMNEFFVLDEDVIDSEFTATLAFRNQSDADLIAEFLTKYQALLIEWKAKITEGPAQTAFFGMFGRLRKIKSIRVHSNVDLLKGTMDDDDNDDDDEPYVCDDCKDSVCEKCGTQSCPDCGECHSCEIVKKIEITPETDPKKLN